MRVLFIHVPRVVFIVIISLFFLILGKSYFTFAQAENGMEFSFLNSKMLIAESPALSSSLIEAVQDISARYEHNIITSTLQSMRVIEGVKAVPAVTLATNDMANFPSAEHSLYPHYLTKRYSQFKYTVDRDGIVGIDTASPTIVCDLEQIEDCLKYIE
ncbi:MAG: hypothetical protein KKD83_02640 [Chloroflexi bacterium]|nr:hypothetical protein [Chloroflexota bacterium]